MQDTLAYHKERPLSRSMDLSEASLLHVISGYSTLRDNLKSALGSYKAKPESEALWFYSQQHMAGLIEQEVELEEPLENYGWVMDQYHEDLSLRTLRMFYYLLLICTRETRHANYGPGLENLYAKYPEITDFHKTHISDSSSDSDVAKMIGYFPNVTLGEYTNFLVDGFQKPAYDEGFGGKAWKVVALPLREFAHGRISAEMLMDTAFTLAHNNGPIFNKGMLYKGADSSDLMKILNVQRSGQIPQLVNRGGFGISDHIEADLREFVSNNVTMFFPQLAGDVIWKDVKTIQGHIAYSEHVATQTHAEAQKKAAITANLHAAAATAQAETGYQIAPNTFIALGARSKK